MKKKTQSIEKCMEKAGGFLFKDRKHIAEFADLHV